MRLLTFVLAITITACGAALSLFGLATIIALACAESAGGCALMSLLIGLPLACLGALVLIES